MKKLKFSAIAILISIAATVLFNGCSGKDGAPGATGPAGAAGNANVTVYNFAVYTSDWQGSAALQFYEYQNTSMNMNGAIEVYNFDSNTNEWTAMPYTYNNISYYYEVNINSGAYIVSIDFASANGTNNVTNPGTQLFRLITIPPAMAKLHPNINYKNYSEVARTFNIN